MSSNTWEKLRWVSYVVLAVWIATGIAIVYLLNQIDSIIHMQLYNYGLAFSYDWANPYWADTHLMTVLLDASMTLSIGAFVLGFISLKRKKPPLKREANLPQVTPEKTAKVQFEKKQWNQKVVNEPDAEHKQNVTSKLRPNGKEFETTQPEIIRVDEHLKSEPPKIIVREEPSAVNAEPVAAAEKPKEKEKPGPVQSCPNCGKHINRPLVMLDFSGGKTRLVNTCPYCMHVLGYESG